MIKPIVGGMIAGFLLSNIMIMQVKLNRIDRAVSRIEQTLKDK